MRKTNGNAFAGVCHDEPFAVSQMNRFAMNLFAVAEALPEA